MRLAVGMVIGKIDDRYQAILLNPALTDVKMDYQLLDAELKSLNIDLCGARPPQAAYSHGRAQILVGIQMTGKIAAILIELH